MDWQGGNEEIVWRPSAEMIAQSNLTHFMRRHGLSDLQQLQQRSTTDLDWFWNAVLEDLNIQFRRRYSQVLDLSRGPAWAQWCVGGIMNIIDNCLAKHEGTPVDLKPAIRFESEGGVSGHISYQELRRQVYQMSNALRNLGFAKGDVIGLLMPMSVEIVVAMLAIINLGAICLPLFSGFGVQAIATRLGDAEAKGLFTADGFLRRGKSHSLKVIADEAVVQVPSMRHLVVLQRLGCEVSWQGERDHWWHELMRTQAVDATIEPTSAEDPLMILYTSGTTGRPKGAVHTHCGFPIKAAQDIRQGLDLHENETLFWVTDMGWMMGPWLVFGTLMLGATMVVYDGALDYPHAGRLWELVEKHKVTSLGISPTLVRSLLPHGEKPLLSHDLSSLRKFASTGEPWNPAPWRWLFEKVGASKLPIINYSGGTEISGGILMGNVLTALKPCAFAGPLPGMAADVVNENGQPVRNAVGELILRQPWIGMTRGFWRDSNRYFQTYWSRFPNVWLHGDWAAVDDDGFWYILGRSDDTIKVAGKRLGPAEVESVLVGHPMVSEAAAIGVRDDLKGERLCCFCVLKEKLSTEEAALAKELQDRVASELGRPLMPRLIHFVSELPKTRNAKVMRRVIRAAYLGEEPGDLSALENPGAIEEIRRLARRGGSTR